MYFVIAVGLLAGIALGQSCWPCSGVAGKATYFDHVGQCCRFCPIGSFCNGTVATACRQGLSYQPSPAQSLCLPLTQCTDAYETRAATLSSNRQCRSLSQCNFTREFERVSPTTTTDRTCTALRTCSDVEFEIKAPTTTTDRECRASIACNTLTELLIANATRTSDTICKCRPNFVGSPCSLCENVISGCNLCNVTVNGTVTCTECLLAFQSVLTPQGQRCVRCDIGNCELCDATNSCIQCKAGFRLSETGACTCGLDGCVACSSSGTCDTCARGFRRLLNGSCACDLYGCAQCGLDGSCVKCNGALIFNGTGCACPPIPFCHACKADGTQCDVCEYLFTEVNGSCVCTLADCAECSSNGCLRCNPNKTLTQDGKCIDATLLPTTTTQAASSTGTLLIGAVIGGVCVGIAIFASLLIMRRRAMRQTHSTEKIIAPPPEELPRVHQNHLYEEPSLCMLPAHPIYDLATVTSGEYVDVEVE